VVSALLRSTEDFTSDEFLKDFHVVFSQLHAWPPAWPGLQELMDAQHPWTQAYCDRVIGSPSWSPFIYFSVNLQGLRPLIRFSLKEVKERTSEGAALFSRYFDALRSSGDAKTLQLLDDFEAQDEDNWKECKVKLGPLEALLEYELSKVSNHILTVCAQNDAVEFVLEQNRFHGPEHIASSCPRRQYSIG